MADKLLSVIVTLYNTEGYLQQCVDSILSQTYATLEVILVDDGSTDNSPAICDGYAAADSRVQVIHQQNQGIPEARKVGMNAATGEYVYFMGSGDWLKPRMASTVMKAIEDTGADMAAFGAVEHHRQFKQLVPPGKAKAGFYPRDRMERELFPRLLGPIISDLGVSIPLFTKVFKYAVGYAAIMRVDPEIRKNVDVSCAYEIIYAADSIVLIKDRLYNYRYMRPGANLNRFYPNQYTMLERLTNHVLTSTFMREKTIAKRVPQLLLQVLGWNDLLVYGPYSPQQMAEQQKLSRYLIELITRFVRLYRNVRSWNADDTDDEPFNIKIDPIEVGPADLSRQTLPKPADLSRQWSTDPLTHTQPDNVPYDSPSAPSLSDNDTDKRQHDNTSDVSPLEDNTTSNDLITNHPTNEQSNLGIIGDDSVYDYQTDDYPPDGVAIANDSLTDETATHQTILPHSASIANPGPISPRRGTRPHKQSPTY